MRISTPPRRDRILLIAAVAVALLTLLGAAGEEAGLDKTLRANTATKRTHSLYFQGTYYYSALPNMKEHRARPLLEAFERRVREHAVSLSFLVSCNVGMPQALLYSLCESAKLFSRRS